MLDWIGLDWIFSLMGGDDGARGVGGWASGARNAFVQVSSDRDA